MLIPLVESTVPLIKGLNECADLSKTITPYLPQLYDLPSQIWTNIGSLEGLKHVYLATNPAISALDFAFVLAPIVLVISEVNDNYSQVDRLWSILPVMYNVHYAIWAHLSGLPTQRLDSVMAISLIWGARLSFNYWRKGGYNKGSEDYRWRIVKNYIGSVPMFLFNVVFISFAQSILLWAITTPTYILLLTSRITTPDPSLYDTLFPAILLSLIAIEFLADNQQWAYHAAKKHFSSTSSPPKDSAYTTPQLARGFNTTGLFAWSRHPNFAAEQTFWVALYQWSCCESWTFANWTGAGAIGYLLLFQASTWLTELISAEKYPEYRVYQEKVSRFLPGGRTRSMDEKDGVEGLANGTFTNAKPKLN